MSAAEPDSGPVVVTPEPAHYRMGPLGTWMHSRAFQVAADASRDLPGRMPAVLGFLYCRAIEQAFKAYLLARGVSIARVRRYKHDLTKLLLETDARGIDVLVSLTTAEKGLIRTASDLYLENKLGYFNLFYALTGPRLPIDELASIAKRLLDALHEPCLEAGDHETWSLLPPRR